ncbi:MAG: YbaK/EbsC family protein [Candidatus Omnitrophica bacterium]|nr:YbaK/EbsC family protein [Candidatus Omnitrophota bacterium]
MAISSRLKAFLQAQHVKYTTQSHPTVYTAQEIAAAQHVPGRQLAKCVLVKTDKGVALAVLPAMYRVDLKKLKTALRAKKLSLASEGDIKGAFPDVEVGAMSPFGHLYNVPTIVDKSLATAGEIVCNAGSHTETLKLSYRDFERFAKPSAGSFVEGAPKKSRKPARKNTTARRSKKPLKRRRR